MKIQYKKNINISTEYNNKYILIYISQTRPILNVFTNLIQKIILCDINYIFGD